jgi:hypothetical protein
VLEAAKSAKELNSTLSAYERPGILSLTANDVEKIE